MEELFGRKLRRLNGHGTLATILDLRYLSQYTGGL